MSLSKLEAGPMMIPPPVLQLIVGASASTTVTVNEQDEVLPFASVAVAVTEPVPTAKKLPEAGDTETVAEQLSDTFALYCTFAPHTPGVLFTLIFDGQVTTGAWLSVTVTTKLQFTELPEGSVAVAVTVVFPTGNKLPDATEVVTVAEQLSVAVAEKFTFAPQRPEPVFTPIFDGQESTGFSRSSTITLKEQVAVFPLPSVTTNVFVVVPTGKVDADGRPAV